MKINPVGQQLIIRNYIGKTRVQDTPGAEPARDQVELSEEAVSFASAMKAARAQQTRSDAELKEIEEITRQVRAGTFNVSGRDIADKMLEGILLDVET